MSKKHDTMKRRMGIMLYWKETQLPMWKAATKAPTNIRKMVPGPRIVPAINIVCNTTYAHQKLNFLWFTTTATY